jgi:hypothetical protein
MTAPNRTLLVALAIVALLAAGWFLILAPKRQQADDLAAKVEPLQASVSQHKQEIANGVAAREKFPRDYQQLVLLGKATPAGGDSASLLVQVNRVAEAAGVQFRSLELSAAESTPAAAPAPTVPTEPSATEPPPADGETPPPATTPPATTVSAAPTEASAAALPIGASVGPAGFGVLPFDLQFDQGDFFAVADFLAGLDRFVETDQGHVAVDGRLMTIDGFSLSADEEAGFPFLTANLSVTTYVTPQAQGITAGASPAAPAPAGAVPASQPTTTTTTPTP